jgi:hypothetical protein
MNVKDELRKVVRRINNHKDNDTWRLETKEGKWRGEWGWTLYVKLTNQIYDDSECTWTPQEVLVNALNLERIALGDVIDFKNLSSAYILENLKAVCREHDSKIC